MAAETSHSFSRQPERFNAVECYLDPESMDRFMEEVEDEIPHVFSSPPHLQDSPSHRSILQQPTQPRGRFRGCTRYFFRNNLPNQRNTIVLKPSASSAPKDEEEATLSTAQASQEDCSFATTETPSTGNTSTTVEDDDFIAMEHRSPAAMFPWEERRRPGLEHARNVHKCSSATCAACRDRDGLTESQTYFIKSPPQSPIHAPKQELALLAEQYCAEDPEVAGIVARVRRRRPRRDGRDEDPTEKPSVLRRQDSTAGSTNSKSTQSTHSSSSSGSTMSHHSSNAALSATAAMTTTTMTTVPIRNTQLARSITGRSADSTAAVCRNDNVPQQRWNEDDQVQARDVSYASDSEVLPARQPRSTHPLLSPRAVSPINESGTVDTAPSHDQTTVAKTGQAPSNVPLYAAGALLLGCTPRLLEDKSKEQQVFFVSSSSASDEDASSASSSASENQLAEEIEWEYKYNSEEEDNTSLAAESVASPERPKTKRPTRRRPKTKLKPKPTRTTMRKSSVPQSPPRVRKSIPQSPPGRTSIRKSSNIRGAWKLNSSPRKRPELLSPVPVRDVSPVDEAVTIRTDRVLSQVPSPDRPDELEAILSQEFSFHVDMDGSKEEGEETMRAPGKEARSSATVRSQLEIPNLQAREPASNTQKRDAGKSISARADEVLARLASSRGDSRKKGSEVNSANGSEQSLKVREFLFPPQAAASGQQLEGAIVNNEKDGTGRDVESHGRALARMTSDGGTNASLDSSILDKSPNQAPRREISYPASATARGIEVTRESTPDRSAIAASEEIKSGQSNTIHGRTERVLEGLESCGEGDSTIDTPLDFVGSHEDDDSEYSKLQGASIFSNWASGVQESMNGHRSPPIEEEDAEESADDGGQDESTQASKARYTDTVKTVPASTKLYQRALERARQEQRASQSSHQSSQRSETGEPQEEREQQSSQLDEKEEQQTKTQPAKQNPFKLSARKQQPHQIPQDRPNRQQQRKWLSRSQPQPERQSRQLKLRWNRQSVREEESGEDDGQLVLPKKPQTRRRYQVFNPIASSIKKNISPPRFGSPKQQRTEPVQTATPPSTSPKPQRKEPPHRELNVIHMYYPPPRDQGDQLSLVDSREEAPDNEPKTKTRELVELREYFTPLDEPQYQHETETKSSMSASKYQAVQMSTSFGNTMSCFQPNEAEQKEVIPPDGLSLPKLDGSFCQHPNAFRPSQAREVRRVGDLCETRSAKISTPPRTSGGGGGFRFPEQYQQQRTSSTAPVLKRQLSPLDGEVGAEPLVYPDPHRPVSIRRDASVPNYQVYNAAIAEPHNVAEPYDLSASHPPKLFVKQEKQPEPSSGLSSSHAMYKNHVHTSTSSTKPGCQQKRPQMELREQQFPNVDFSGDVQTQHYVPERNRFEGSSMFSREYSPCVGEFSYMPRKRTPHPTRTRTRPLPPKREWKIPTAPGSSTSAMVSPYTTSREVMPIHHTSQQHARNGDISHEIFQTARQVEQEWGLCDPADIRQLKKPGKSTSEVAMQLELLKLIRSSSNQGTKKKSSDLSLITQAL